MLTIFRFVVCCLAAWAAAVTVAIAVTVCTARFGPDGLESISISGSEVARAIIIHSSK